MKIFLSVNTVKTSLILIIILILTVILILLMENLVLNFLNFIPEKNCINIQSCNGKVCFKSLILIGNLINLIRYYQSALLKSH